MDSGYHLGKICNIVERDSWYHLGTLITQNVCVCVRPLQGLSVSSLRAGAKMDENLLKSSGYCNFGLLFI